MLATLELETADEVATALVDSAVELALLALALALALCEADAVERAVVALSDDAADAVGLACRTSKSSQRGTTKAAARSSTCARGKGPRLRIMRWWGSWSRASIAERRDAARATKRGMLRRVMVSDRGVLGEVGVLVLVFSSGYGLRESATVESTRAQEKEVVERREWEARKPEASKTGVHGQRKMKCPNQQRV